MTAPSPPPNSSRESAEAHRRDDSRSPCKADDATEAAYGFPAPLWRALERHRPPGMGLLQRWRSPLRGPWLTSVFGSVLLVGLPVVILTGLLSYIAYGPQFGQAIPVNVGWLKLPTFDWPSRPSWLYRLTQGVHVGLGLIIIPVVLAKLWSVIPRLFAWPPLRSIAAACGAAVVVDAGGRDPSSSSPPECSISSTTTYSDIPAFTPRTTTGRGCSSPASSSTC